MRTKAGAWRWIHAVGTAMSRGPDGRARAQVCQLGPGMFVHREVEKHLNNGATRVAA